MPAPRARWPWLLVGGALAGLPLACTGGDTTVGVDLPDTTPFRTTIVEVVTTTTSPPTTAPAPTSSVLTLPPGEGGTYTVVAGDYWIGIAEKLGVALAALLAANGATTDSFLSPGQQLSVPAGATVGTSTPAGSSSSMPATSAGGTYTIVAGDYWIGIAEKLGVPLEALLAANGATTDTFLAPGETLRVP